MGRSSIPCAVELDGAMYGFAGGRLEQISDIDDLDGDKWLISDMQEAIARVMTIESSAKYAEILVQRKLQESGEFDEPATVITHWKKRRGRNNTDIYFTAIPTRLSHYYSDQIQKKDDAVLLFPLYKVLFDIVRRIGSKQPIAVVFQHDRFADVIVATKDRVYHAHRFVAFSKAEEEISALWENVHSDIGIVETEHRIRVEKIFFLNWIDSAPQPEWPETAASEFYLIEQDAVSYQDKNYPISFFNAVGKLTGFRSVSSPVAKAAYYAGKWSYQVQAIMLAIILLLGAGGLWYQQQTARLEDQVQVLRKQIAEIQMPAPAMYDPEAYRSVLAFIKALDRNRSVPSFRQVINDMSEAGFQSLKLDLLKLDYTDRAIQVEVYGRVDAPFGDAHRGYQRFLKIVKTKGYGVQDSRFDTEINTSNILIKLVKTI